MGDTNNIDINSYLEETEANEDIFEKREKDFFRERMNSNTIPIVRKLALQYQVPATSRR